MASNFLTQWFFAYPGMKRTASTGFGASEQWKIVGGGSSKYAQNLEAKRSNLLKTVNNCNKIKACSEPDITNLIKCLKVYESYLNLCLENGKIERSGVVLYWESLIYQSHPGLLKYLLDKSSHKFFCSFDLSFEMYNMFQLILFCLMRMAIRLLVNIQYKLSTTNQTSSFLVYNQTPSSEVKNGNITNSLKLAREILITCVTLAKKCKVVVNVNDINYFDEETMKGIMEAHESEFKKEQREKAIKAKNSEKEKKNKKKDDDSDDLNENQSEKNFNNFSSDLPSYLPKSYKPKPKNAKKKSMSFESDMDDMFLSFIIELLRSLNQEIVFLKLITGGETEHTKYLLFSISKFCSDAYERTSRFGISASNDKFTVKMLQKNSIFKHLFYSAASNHYASKWHLNKAEEAEKIASKASRTMNQQESQLSKNHRGYAQHFANSAYNKLQEVFKSEYGTLLNSYKKNISQCDLFNRIISDIQTNYSSSKNMGMMYRVDIAAQMNAPLPQADENIKNAGYVGELTNDDWDMDDIEVVDDSALVNKIDNEKLMHKFQGRGDLIRFDNDIV